MDSRLLNKSELLNKPTNNLTLSHKINMALKLVMETLKSLKMIPCTNKQIQESVKKVQNLVIKAQK